MLDVADLLEEKDTTAVFIKRSLIKIVKSTFKYALKEVVSDVISLIRLITFLPIKIGSWISSFFKDKEDGVSYEEKDKLEQIQKEFNNQQKEIKSFIINKYPNEGDRPVWYEKDIVVSKTTIKNYFSSLTMENKENLLPKFFILQHEFMNNSSADEEERNIKEEELNSYYEQIAHSILDNDGKNLEENEKKLAVGYIKFRIKEYSQFLVANSKTFFQKMAYILSVLVFCVFDAIADGLGLVLTSFIEDSTNLSESLSNLTEILGSLGGAIFPLLAGIFIQFAIKIAIKKSEEKGIQVPNSNIAEYARNYLEAKRNKKQGRLNEIKHDVNFSAKIAKLENDICKINKILHLMDEAEQKIKEQKDKAEHKIKEQKREQERQKYKQEADNIRVARANPYAKAYIFRSV